MDLRRLRYFSVVVEEQHITRAAQRIGIQQPPLSQQIRHLENELGVTLFKRVRRGVEPTEAGLVLYRKLQPLFAQMEEAVEAARSTARGEQGRLVIGVSSSAVLSPALPRFIRRFRRSAPGVSVSLQEDDAEELMAGLKHERVDVVFTRSPTPDPAGIAMLIPVEEEMMAVLPSNHPLKARSQSGLRLSALANEKFILYRRPGGPGLYDIIVAACRAAGFNPHIAEEALRLPSALNFVAAGLGVTIVPASLRRFKTDGIIYRRLRGCSDLKAPLYVLSRSGDPSGPVGRFLEHLKLGEPAGAKTSMHT